MNDISFIIPTLNSEKYIKRCLLSILKQNTNIKYEIIILDASNDSLTKNEVVSLNSDKVKYYKVNDRGVSYSRNIGITKSNSMFVSFVDSDDKLGKYFFRNLENTENFRKYDIIKTYVNVIDTNEYDERFDCEIFEKLNGIDSLHTFIKENKIFATPWSYIFKRNIFIDNNLFFKEGRVHEDLLLIPLLISRANSVKSVNWIGYKYIKRKDSLSTKDNVSSELLRYNDFLLNIQDLLNEFQDYNSLKKYFKERLVIKTNNLNKEVKLKLDYYKIDKVLSPLREVHFNKNDLFSKDLKLAMKVVKAILNDNLISIILGGSMGKSRHISNWSDIDLYIIIKEHDYKNIIKLQKELNNIETHIGTTFYNYNQIKNHLIDNKTKIMFYEKKKYNFNPTIYGTVDIPSITYNNIVENDILQLLNTLPSFKRMYFNIKINKTKVNKIYIKKLYLLIKTYLNTINIFTYCYDDSFHEIINLINKNKVTNKIKFDIINEINKIKLENDNYDKSSIISFSEDVLNYIEKDDNYAKKS